MSKTNTTVEKKVGGFTELTQIVDYVGPEQWEFKYEVSESNGPAVFEISLFNGILYLRSDGTWDYKE